MSVVEDHDLTRQLTIIPYELTKRFRFDAPGKYTVKFSTDIGLDDASNPRPELYKAMKVPQGHHSVNVDAEFQLEIVPADAQWQKEVVRKGYEAYLCKELPKATNPPSPELVRHMSDKNGLCELGTPEAARVLVELLLRRHSEVRSCLWRLRDKDVAVQEMERLLSDPNAVISPEFFTEFQNLRNEVNRKLPDLSQVDHEWESLVAALPNKQGDALIVSLLAVLHHPLLSQKSPPEWGIDSLPFDDAILARTAANFEHFPPDEQKWLLTDNWDLIRSTYMLPVVQRLAENGDGFALLRWQELAPPAANAFVRAEILRPEPRFSSFYLRLPQPLLPAEEEQLASNFVKLAEQYSPNTYNEGLIRVTTLLHHYGSRAILSTVLPAINEYWRMWSCTMEYPALAYLLKVSPEDAAPKLEEAVRNVNQGPCTTSTFFTDLGLLQPSPILERLAFAQLEDSPGPFAPAAADYLRRYGSAGAKPHVWERLQYWQGRLATLKKATASPMPSVSEQQQIASALFEAFWDAQGWLLTPEDESRLLSLLGDGAVKSAACGFSCGANLSVSGPADFSIYKTKMLRNYQRAPILDYLQPPNPYRYSIQQYGCPNMQALKDKLLQFPKGSSFSFAWDFPARDRDELVEISDFLWNHNYIVRNPQEWDFLRADSPK